MISSMTGYGRAEGEIPQGHLTIELKSVNHRYLDCRARLPRLLSSVETVLLSHLKTLLSRGRVEINVTLADSGESSVQPTLNLPLARAYRDLAGEAAKGLGLPDAIPLDYILRMPDVVRVEDSETDPDEIWESVRPILEQAVEALVAMRNVEGQAAADDFRKTLEELRVQRAELEEVKDQVVVEYREKLQTRIGALLEDNGGLDPARLHQEVALFADRCDISEELARLDSHLNQFAEMIRIPEPVGRKLDFLLQEIFREINTVGSKANHITVKQIALNMKNSVEKLREQVQNVE